MNEFCRYRVGVSVLLEWEDNPWRLLDEAVSVAVDVRRLQLKQPRERRA
jgi:hypothetical protein